MDHLFLKIRKNIYKILLRVIYLYITSFKLNVDTK